MKKKKGIVRNIVAGFCCIFLLVGCSQEKESISSSELLEKLLNDVTYETELEKKEVNESLYFPELPENVTVDFYTGSGYYADEIALFTLADENDADAVVSAAQTHIDELKDQFQNYIPEEVQKIEHAVLMEKGQCVFLCITSDYETANKILGQYEISSVSKIEDDTLTADTSEQEDQSDESQSEEVVEPEEEYPVLTSKSGTFQKYDTVIRVDDAAYEEYVYVDSSASNYANIVNQVAAQVEAQVYDIAIPTAIGIVLPDDIREQLTTYSDQEEATEKIYAKLSDNVKAVRCFQNLMKHRDEYLYFRTDFHWNGTAAYYAYESFCETKGIEAISMEEREEVQFDGFLGALYWDETGKDENLGANPDTVYAYYPKSENVTMVYTDQNGTEVSWDIIADVSEWKASTKYSTFAGADNPITVFENPDVTDGSVCVIVKESFGNALMSYLVDHYSTIYEIDYRYWDGNLIDFVNEKQADDLIFANNMSMIRSNYLIGKLSGIID